MIQNALKSFIGYLNWKSGDICLLFRCYREREETAKAGNLPVNCAWYYDKKKKKSTKLLK